MTKNVLTFIRLGALVGFISCAAYVASARPAPADTTECYDLMMNQCNREASNAAEGGYDVAYDACVANWYANSGCERGTPGATPLPTVGNAPMPVFAPAKRPRPVRK